MSTYVLVHGAWGGSYGWRAVRPLLQQQGHTVFSPSLTGQGERAHLASPSVDLSTHIQDVCNAIWYEDLSDIILVGHSYGGMVVTGVVDRMPERVAHLVYLDAFVPASGQSLLDMTGNRENQLQPQPQPADWRIPPMQRTEDASTPEAQWNLARRQPQSRATFDQRLSYRTPLEEQPFSLTYIVATGRPDPGPVFEQLAQRFRGQPRWTVREIDGGHNMIRTNPDGLVRLFGELFPTRDAIGARP